LRAESDKGTPLTIEEVHSIRDKGPCVMLPRTEASKMAQARGYDDIDPEQAWEQWQLVRQQLHATSNEV
jgi:hypothetical protein